MTKMTKRRKIVGNRTLTIEEAAKEFFKYWDIGEVFARLIEDTYSENNVFIGLREVYKSWLAEKLMNYNSDLYYQSRDYLVECYRQGRMIEDSSGDIDMLLETIP